MISPGQIPVTVANTRNAPSRYSNQWAAAKPVSQMPLYKMTLTTRKKNRIALLTV
jgi:hypothetical protein